MVVHVPRRRGRIVLQALRGGGDHPGFGRVTRTGPAARSGRAPAESPVVGACRRRVASSKLGPGPATGLGGNRGGPAGRFRGRTPAGSVGRDCPQAGHAGHPDAAVLLAEHAHRRAEEALAYVDDSDGWLSIISERLFEVHLRACTDGSPEPVALAGRLLQLELASDLEGFRRAPVAYAEVLGDAGLTAYREHLESRRRRIVGSAGSSRREIDSYALQDAMVGWALAIGDPDVLIDVHRRGGGGAPGRLDRRGCSGGHPALRGPCRRGLERGAGIRVRTEHRAKRNLKKLLDDRGW